MAIPFATTGSVWSWIRRHYIKHWLNSLVSVLSLGILFGVFVPILFRQITPGIDLFPSETRTLVAIGLTLAAIVISLQMGLSFQLYSRRILGYGLLISTVLIGIAASLSSNISFLILLGGFMAIAIPTLMLDYRSRLALQPIGIQSVPAQGQLSYQSLPWQYLIQLAAISIGVGIGLAIFLPTFRLPNLSFKPPGLEQIKPLIQPPRQSPNPQLPPATTNSSAPINQQELARQVFGQPTNNNYPDLIKQENLQLPPELANQLKQFTQQVLSTSPQPLNSDFDRSTYIAEYLKQHHQDSPLPVPPANLPPLDPKSIQSLITQCTKDPEKCKLVGNKQDLPVVYTSMLRSIGIPTRLKSGEQPAQIDPQTKLYPRPPNQSNSQTEMYSPNWGWVKLDSTPDRPVVKLTPPEIERLQAQVQQQLGATPPPQPNQHQSIDNSPPPPQQNASNSPPPPADISKDFDPNILKVIMILIAIMGGIAWYLWYRRQAQQQLATLPPIEQIYRSMILSLSKTGNTKIPAQTQLEYASSIKNTEHPQIAKIVTEISQLYTAWRYGNLKIDAKHLAKKLQQLQHLQQLAATRKRKQWIANQKALWIPMSGNVARK